MNRRGIRGLAVLAAGSLALAACGTETEPVPAAAAPAVHEPVAITYEGGLYVLDGDTLDVRHTVALPGFNRINPAGDDRTVVVSTDAGFQLLDAAAGRMTDVTYPGAKPGHVVRHAGRTVLFTDGTGEVNSFDPQDLASGTKPQGKQYKTAVAHHGVAVELADGTSLLTVGTEESRTGALAQDAAGKELARNEECPGVHGEAAAKDEIVGFGCEDGVLLYKDGAFTKIDGGREYSRIGNQAGSDASPVLLGDYKIEPDAELERPAQFSLIDTVAEKITVVPMPEGVSYSFRSLNRGPAGEGLILGTDGKLHVIDPATAKITASWPVVAEWQEPLDWQQPRPAIFVRGDVAYVTEPATKQVHRVDLATGAVSKSATLEAAPNEISGAVASH